MENNDHTGMYISVIGLGFAVWFVRAYILPMIRLNNMKTQYQSIAEPQLFTQAGETDDEFWARVERAKARFIDVKNRWAMKQVPVIAIPQDQSFVIDWFGKQYPFSTVGLGQKQYHRMSVAVYDILYEVWCKETGIFGAEKVAIAKGQQPFNGQEIWNQN